MEAMVIDDGFRDGARDFGWKPAEVVALLGAEGDRVIAVVVDPVTGPSLAIMALSRRNAVAVLLPHGCTNHGLAKGHCTAFDKSMFMAIHEAGHAVFAALGPYRRVSKITLLPDQTLEGNKASVESVEREDFREIRPENLWHDIPAFEDKDWFQGAINIGGPTAQVLYAPESVGSYLAEFRKTILMPERDYRDAISCFNELAWVHDLKMFLDRREFVRQGRYWTKDNSREVETAVRARLERESVKVAVLKVAEQLVVRRHLAGDEFYSIISTILSAEDYFTRDEAIHRRTKEMR